MDTKPTMPKLFQNQKDQHQFESICVGLSEYDSNLPQVIVNEIGFCATGKCYSCSCTKPCSTDMNVLQYDWDNHLHDIGNKEWSFIGGKFWCINCVKTGPVVEFDCCGSQCIHGDSAKTCAFHNREEIDDYTFGFLTTFCVDSNGEDSCLSFSCDCLGENDGIRTICHDRFVCEVHSSADYIYCSAGKHTFCCDVMGYCEYCWNDICYSCNIAKNKDWTPPNDKMICANCINR